MPSLGPLEILVVFVVALLVFGPNKLPELARQVGRGLAEFRKVQHHLKGELDDAIHSVMDDDKAKVAPPSGASALLPGAPTTGGPTDHAQDGPDDGPPDGRAGIEADETAAPAGEAAATTEAERIDRGPTPPPLADDA